MFIQQLSVFLENKPGRLEDFTQLLAENSIDLLAISLADTTDFGIVRAIVNNTAKAVELLRENGYTAKLTDVLAVAVSDTPGGLALALKVLGNGDVAVEYLYSFVRNMRQSAIIIMKVRDPAHAVSLLQETGLRLLGQDEVSCE